MLHRIAAEQVHHHVGATACGSRPDPRRNVAGLVVEGFGAEATQRVQLGRRAGGRQHARPRRQRQLHHERTDAAAGRRHQHGLAWRHAGAIERVTRGQPPDREGRRLGQVIAVGQPDGVARRHHHAVGMAAAPTGQRHDRITEGERRHAGAKRRHPPGRFKARHERIRRQVRIGAAQAQEVAEIEAEGGNCDLDLTGTGRIERDLGNRHRVDIGRPGNQHRTPRRRRRRHRRRRSRDNAVGLHRHVDPAAATFERICRQRDRLCRLAAPESQPVDRRALGPSRRYRCGRRVIIEAGRRVPVCLALPPGTRPAGEEVVDARNYVRRVVSNQRKPIGHRLAPGLKRPGNSGEVQTWQCPEVSGKTLGGLTQPLRRSRRDHDDMAAVRRRRMPDRRRRRLGNDQHGVGAAGAIGRDGGNASPTGARRPRLVPGKAERRGVEIDLRAWPNGGRHRRDAAMLELQHHLGKLSHTRCRRQVPDRPLERAQRPLTRGRAKRTG